MYAEIDCKCQLRVYIYFKKGKEEEGRGGGEGQSCLVVCSTLQNDADEGERNSKHEQDRGRGTQETCAHTRHRRTGAQAHRHTHNQILTSIKVKSKASRADLPSWHACIDSTCPCKS